MMCTTACETMSLQIPLLSTAAPKQTQPKKLSKWNYKFDHMKTEHFTEDVHPENRRISHVCQSRFISLSNYSCNARPVGSGERGYSKTSQQRFWPYLEYRGEHRRI